MEGKSCCCYSGIQCFSCWKVFFMYVFTVLSESKIFFLLLKELSFLEEVFKELMSVFISAI